MYIKGDSKSSTTSKVYKLQAWGWWGVRLNVCLHKGIMNIFFWAALPHTSPHPPPSFPPSKMKPKMWNVNLWHPNKKGGGIWRFFLSFLFLFPFSIPPPPPPQKTENAKHQSCGSLIKEDASQDLFSLLLRFFLFFFSISVPRPHFFFPCFVGVLLSSDPM